MNDNFYPDITGHADMERKFGILGRLNIKFQSMQPTQVDRIFDKEIHNRDILKLSLNFNTVGAYWGRTGKQSKFTESELTEMIECFY